MRLQAVGGGRRRSHWVAAGCRRVQGASGHLRERFPVEVSVTCRLHGGYMATCVSASRSRCRKRKLDEIASMMNAVTCGGRVAATRVGRAAVARLLRGGRALVAWLSRGGMRCPLMRARSPLATSAQT